MDIEGTHARVCVCVCVCVSVCGSVSINAKKAFDKTQHPLMIKTLTKVGIEETYLNIVKAIDDKPTDNIILNVEKLKAFTLKPNIRQGRTVFSPFFFNIILQDLDTAIRK